MDTIQPKQRSTPVRVAFIPLILMLMALLFALSCKKEIGNEDDGLLEPIGSGYEWIDASIKLPSGSTYKLEGHELNAVGEIVKVNSNGATKVPKMTNSVAIYIVTNVNEEPVLMGFSTPQKTEISPEATAKVTLFYLYRIASLPTEAQVSFLEGFDVDKAANSYIENFVAHWATNPKTLINKGYLNLLKTYHARYGKTDNEVPTAMRNQQMGRGGRYYYADADTGKLENGYSLRLEKPNKFYLLNKGPATATAFIYKTTIKKNNSLNHQTLISTFESGTKSDKNWFIANGTYRPTPGLIFGEVDYRMYSFGAMRFNEVSSGPHELPLAEDEEEAQYIIRIINAGINASSNKLTSAEYSAYVKHMCAALVIDYYLPFLGTYMGLTIQDFYALDPEVRVNKMDAAMREAGLHSIIDENLAGGRMPVLLEFLENYFQSANTEYGLKLHQAIFKAVGKSGSAKMVSAAKRGGYLSYYFDGGAFWDAEREKSLFKDFYWEKNGLITLNAMAKAGVVRVSPRKATVTALAPGNSVVLNVEIESEEFKGLDVTYRWRTIGAYGVLNNQNGNKITYLANKLNANHEDSYEIIYADVLKDNQLIGTDSATVYVSQSRYQMVPRGVVLTGNTDNGANIATMRIIPLNANGLDINNDAAYDFRVDWSTEGKFGGLRWQGQYATYWTKEAESYNSGNIQYRCEDDKTPSGTETIKASIYIKPKGSADMYYQFYDYVIGTIDIINDKRKKVFNVPISVINWGPTDDGLYTHCGAGTIFYINPVENAESYNARVIEFSPEVIPRVTGTTRSWTAASGTLNAQGKYEFGYVLAISGSSPTWMGPPDCAGFISNAAARKGMAQVIVTLKP